MLCQAGPHAHISSHRVTQRWEKEEEGGKRWKSERHERRFKIGQEGREQEKSSIVSGGEKGWKEKEMTSRGRRHIFRREGRRGVRGWRGEKEHTGLEGKIKWEQAATELVSGEDRQDIPDAPANPTNADMIDWKRKKKITFSRNHYRQSNSKITLLLHQLFYV